MERITANDIPAGLIESLRNVENYVNNSGLDHRLLELMRLRVSLINNCARCIDMHYKLAIYMGETPLRLMSVSAWRETPYYTEKEQAVLEFAELLTKMPNDQHSTDIHDELLKHFSKAEIAHLTLAVAQINSWNRISRSFGSTPGNFQVPSEALEKSDQ